MTDVYILEIQESLRDRTQRTSNQMKNNVENRLSPRKRSSGGEANVAPHDEPDEQEELIDTLYTLGQQYGGDAKGQVR